MPKIDRSTLHPTGQPPKRSQGRPAKAKKGKSDPRTSTRRAVRPKNSPLTTSVDTLSLAPVSSYSMSMARTIAAPAFVPPSTIVPHVDRGYSRIPSPDELEDLAAGIHGDPHTVLGAHSLRIGGSNETVFRALFPPGESVFVLAKPRGSNYPEMRIPMQGQGGLYQAKLPGENFDYRFERITADHSMRTCEDPYRFEPTVADTDLYLFKEGTLENVADLLGAHEREIDGVKGFNFVVWAPNAQSVSVVGDFNEWDPLRQPMRKLGESVWEIFVPEVKDGQAYKFSILNAQGERVLKSDPAGQRFELRPKNASVTVGTSSYEWQDANWVKARPTMDDADQPVSVYEMHLPSWKRGPNGEMLGAREAAEQLVKYVKDNGFTHIELVGLSEYPYDPSWGYQVTGYYAPTARLGAPDDLKFLVDQLHQAGVGVIMDWVPAHFPKDAFALNEFDGTHLFDYADDREGAQKDWGTRVFDYKRPEVRSFLLGSAMHFVDKYHIDGLRVDAVASMLYRDYSRGPGEWLPNEKGGRENLEAISFLQLFNERMEARYPGILTIAEESTAFPGITTPVAKGGLGFDRKWNMGWMHDTLDFLEHKTEDRGRSLDLLTNTLLWAHSEQYELALSHDEVVHLKKSMLEKMPGDEKQKFADLRNLYSYMLAYPGQKMIFMGDEFGQRKEWNENGELQWEMTNEQQAQGLQKLVARLNEVYKKEPALHDLQFDPEANHLVVRDTENAVVGILREAEKADDNVLLLSNFTPNARHKYRVGVDAPGVYREILNSDAAEFGGSNVGNPGGVTAEAVPAHGKEYSIEVTLPPLATVAFKKS